MPYGLKKTIKWILEPTNFLFLLLSLVPVFLVSVFIFIHKENIIWSDEQWSLPIVLAIRNGNFDISYLFANHGGHYTVFSFITSALLALTTDYNIIVGLVFDVALVILTYILIARLFHRSQPDASVFMLLVFSMLFFSVDMDTDWLVILCGSSWFSTSLFFVLGLWLLVRYSDSWPAIVAAALLSLCATFSTGAGLLSWFVLGGLLYFRGYHKWGYYLFWAASTAAALTLFMVGNSSAIDIATSGHLAGILDIARFVLYYLGSIFVSRFYLGSYLNLNDVAMFVGLVGLILLLVNVSYLWWKERDWDTCTAWLALAGFSLAGLALAAIDVLEPGQLPSRRHGYVITTTLFWVAFVALAAIVVWRISRRAELKHWLERALALGNIGIGIALFALYIIQNQRIEATSAISSHPDNWAAGTPITEECAVDYVFTLDGTCLAEWRPRVDLMAAYRLNVFAYTSPTLILPESYENGQPVLVETDSAWQSIHIRDWSLAGVEENTIIFVFSEDLGEDVSLPDLLDHTITNFTRNDMVHINDFLGDADAFWYIRQRRHPSRLDAFFEDLATRGYIPANESEHDPGGYLITEYRLAETVP
jgi:hypothetical protein